MVHTLQFSSLLQFCLFLMISPGFNLVAFFSTVEFDGVSENDGCHARDVTSTEFSTSSLRRPSFNLYEAPYVRNSNTLPLCIATEHITCVKIKFRTKQPFRVFRVRVFPLKIP